MKQRKNLPLPESELRAILRAADEIIAEGGRTLLTKILKGSKEQKLLELGSDRNPWRVSNAEILTYVMRRIQRIIQVRV